MLAKSRVCATVATRDLENAKRFHAEVLKLPVLAADDRRGVHFHAGSGASQPVRARADATGTVRRHLSRGGPRPRMVYADETGFRVAWFKDNVLSLEQLPKTLGV